MIYRTVLCLWLVLFLYPGGIKAQVYSDRKVRNFKVTEKTTVEVSNKYGKIHVITWKKDSARFEVDLRISTNSYQKMDKLRSNIGFDFSGSKSYVKAKTEFSNQAGIISDFVDAFIPSNQVTINYMVYVPEYVNLKIENKFGDIYIDDYHGNLQIELSNGNLKANKLSGDPRVNLGSSDGVINSITDGKITASYSDIEVKEFAKLRIESKSSKFILYQGSDVDIESKRDKFRIENVRNLLASGYFTSIAVGNLDRELNCDLKYGDLRVSHVNDRFSLININSENTDIDLYFDRSTSYLLDIVHHNEVHINLPASLTRIETKVIDAAEKQMLTYGKIGTTATETSHKVKINAPKKCIINIIHR